MSAGLIVKQAWCIIPCGLAPAQSGEYGRRAESMDVMGENTTPSRFADGYVWVCSKDQGWYMCRPSGE